MKRVALAATCLLMTWGPAAAQSWAPWYRPSLLDRAPSQRAALPPQSFSTPDSDDDEDETPRRQRHVSPKQLEGGARPSIAAIAPQSVAFPSSYSPGTIVIDTAGRKLYLVRSKTSAYRYPIAVGREGFTWTGTEKISRIADWPDWIPPKEMRERDPRLPERMTGGIHNPLGARALYLGNTLYRIHGTNAAQSIGRAGSSGCFRMLNGHVMDLSHRVGVGTTVIVLKGLPHRLAKARAE